MGKAIIIGAGGVGSVVAHKCAQHPEIFTELVLASRTKEKCDLVICLSHLGWPAKDPLSDSNVFTQTEGVDLVLGGHSHTFMKELEWLTDAQGKRVPVDQNGKHAIYVGRIVLNLSR